MKAILTIEPIGTRPSNGRRLHRLTLAQGGQTDHFDAMLSDREVDQIVDLASSALARAILELGTHARAPAHPARGTPADHRSPYRRSALLGPGRDR